MQSSMPGSVELRCVHRFSDFRLHSPASGPLRLRKHSALTCQVQTRPNKKGSGVTMRELPLPGSETAKPQTTAKQAYISKPTTQQASNGQTYSTRPTAQQDAARRNSNQEASTSSSPSSVSFEPYQKSSIVRANGSMNNGNQRALEAKTYDAITSVNQAAPGFTAASLAASASTDQKAESLLAEAEGQSKSLRMAVAVVPALVYPSVLHLQCHC